MTKQVFNFSAGPATLPQVALEKASKAVLDFENTGIGILCHSHRSPEFTTVIEEAEARFRRLLSVPDSHAVLFLQGGASTQFSMLPMNLLGEGQTADYIDTGAWSTKAIKEAKREGNVHVAGSSSDADYTHVPEELSYSDKPTYVHFTSNNTIFGTQWATEPTPPSGAALCCDASSDILSRPLDVSKYGVLYAGAQKNLGPSGITIVFVKKTLAETAPKTLPTMLQYRTHIEKGSLFNTPPTFPIYVVGEVLRWLEDFGGLNAIAEYNQAKANALYSYLDESKCFSPTARAGSRSLMNVCFRSTSKELDAEFVKEASQKGLAGLKGHRSVGGMRASIYNAFPKEGVDALISFMKDFESSH